MVCFDDILKKYNTKMISGCGVIEHINIHTRLSPTICRNKKKWPRFEVPKVQVRENGSA